MQDPNGFGELASNAAPASGAPSSQWGPGAPAWPLTVGEGRMLAGGSARRSLRPRTSRRYGRVYNQSQSCAWRWLNDQEPANTLIGVHPASGAAECDRTSAGMQSGYSDAPARVQRPSSEPDYLPARGASNGPQTGGRDGPRLRHERKAPGPQLGRGRLTCHVCSVPGVTREISESVGDSHCYMTPAARMPPGNLIAACHRRELRRHQHVATLSGPLTGLPRSGCQTSPTDYVARGGT